LGLSTRSARLRACVIRVCTLPILRSFRDLASRGGPAIARVYAALVYVASLALLYGAAVLTGTRAREAFIFVFLPGIICAVLALFIWTGHRSAMILAFAVAVGLELIMAANDLASWSSFLVLPIVFGLLTILGLAAAPPAAARAPARVADEVYAAVVYFAALLAVFMAPFNHSRQLGLQTVALCALAAGIVLGMLSVLIWRGRIWAMVAAFALSLAYWLVLGNMNPLLLRSPGFALAPLVSGALTIVCVAIQISAKRAAARASSSAPASE
jgi:hypothetical protein